MDVKRVSAIISQNKLDLLSKNQGHAICHKLESVDS
jgi:hypothetical protein